MVKGMLSKVVQGEAHTDTSPSHLETNDYVLELILRENWRDVIKILTQDMDPWNIDLVLLSQRFSNYLDEMKQKDLKIPGKMILVAAIIYRMKSEVLKESEDDEQEELNLIEDDVFSPELTLTQVNEEQIELNLRKIMLPPIKLPVKKPVKRKVSLYELINALDKALKTRNRREAKEIFNIDLKDFDITEAIEDVYEKIINHLEKEDKTFFSRLLPEEHTAEEKILTLQSLLHLAFEGRIYCWQEKPFDDIHIIRGDTNE